MSIRRPHPSAVAAAGVYLLLLLAALLEKVGRTTSDTKTPLIESPAEFLRGAVSLWNPQLSLGELQNQAYGYLFPQGPFFLLGDLAHVPPWVTERLWTTLVLVVGCEGGRRLARAVGLAPWAAWVAGMAYGLNPRVVAQVGVRSAEVLPGVVLPWVLLPVVLALTGRLGVRTAAVLSVAAFMCGGAVNGTATAAPLPLVVVVIVWGVRRGLVGWRLLGWWSGLLVVTSVWWAASLLRLNAYSPPFFDFVEDAKVTTGTTGAAPALRGTSNWVNYLFTGEYPTWPAGSALSYTPLLVLSTGLLAAVGVVGLVTWRSAWRPPLLLGACLGLLGLVLAHAAPVGSPLAPVVADLLDGPLALLRNVHKIDPVLRLPLALGVGAAFAAAAAAARARGRVTEMSETSEGAGRGGRSSRAWPGRVAAVGVVVLTLATVQPAVALDLRTPGWSAVPDHWQQTADYLAAQPGDPRAWIVPGSGFGVQTWGWTMDEPMSAVATTPWVTRSQVPLVPPETIRVLSRLEELLDSGAGSPSLGRMLARMGITHVVVRHDLDPTLSEATSASLVAIAMARSRGVTRVASFGALDFGPAIEVYAVDRDRAPELQLRSEADAVTVGGASSDVLDAVGAGLVDPGRVAVVQGDDGWDRPADVVGDSYRLRERNFGRVHDAEGPALSVDEPRHGQRIVPDYPANPGSRPVVARYTGIDHVDASSSQGFPIGLGMVRPENAPYSAVDADPRSGWRSALYEDPVGQWLEVALDQPRDLGRLTLTSTVSDSQVEEVRRWRVEAGPVSRTVEVDPFTGTAEVDLSGVVTDRVRVVVDAVVRAGATGPVSLLDLSFSGLPAGRTLVVPPTTAAPDVDYVLSARPETRTCITTLLGPDCQYARGRLSDESVGIDRVLDVPATGRWTLEGSVVGRSRPGTVPLLDPYGSRVVVRGSSALASDPTVAPRMAYDTSTTTSWISDPYDPAPTLSIDFSRPRRISRIAVGQPAYPAVSPTRAVLRWGRFSRTVDLGGFGTFTPLRTKHLEITFTNPTRGLSPIGMSELYLAPGSLGVPLDGAGPTGAVCGFGPPVSVDGTLHPTRVDGFMGDLVSAGPLKLTLCEPSLRLGRGTHRVRVLSTEQFQPVRVRLASTEPDRAVAPPRGMEVVDGTVGDEVVDVAAGEAAILSTARNFNRGWVAELDGERLAPQHVDGWAQGWRVPAGDGGRVRIVFAPERSYVAVLVGGLAVALGVLLVALVLLVLLARSRRGRGVRAGPGAAPVLVDPAAPRRRGQRGRRWWVVALLVLALPAWLLVGLGGPLACLAGVGAVLLGRSALPAAVVLLAASPLLAAVRLQQGEPVLGDPADLLAATGFVLAVLTTVLPRRVAGAP